MSHRPDWESRVGRRLKLRHLRIFSAVVESGSMVKAAVRLGLSQPTVSEVIAELEHTFGVRLLDRSPRGVEPTIYGDALLKRSIAAFDELKQSSRDIEFLADPTVGELWIGCPDALSATVLYPVIVQFSGLFPSVVIHVDDVSSDAALRAQLRDRKCDLILARSQAFADEGDLSVEILFDDPLLVVADARNRWLRHRRIALAELIDEPWTVPATRDSHLAGVFRACGLAMPKTSLVTRSVPLRVQLLADGRYITALAQSTIQLYATRHNLKVLPVDLPDLPWPVAVATLKHRTLSPIVERFIACAREIAKSFSVRPLSRKL